MGSADTIERTVAPALEAAGADIRARLLEKGGVVFPREIPVRIIRVIRTPRSRKETA